MVDKFDKLWTKIDEMSVECYREDRSAREVLDELMQYVGGLFDEEEREKEEEEP